MRRLVLFLGVLLLSSGVWAVSAEEFEKALEVASVQAVQRVKQEDEYAKFNPHLTQEQLEEIPALLEGVLARFREVGYDYLTAADVVVALQMHFEDTTFGANYSNSQTTRSSDGRKIINKRGSTLQHSMWYAFCKVMPKSALPAGYTKKKFVPVTDWENFHNLCQLHMNRIYGILHELQDCDWEVFKDIFINIM